jgi:NTP pyrophosphatase (non-canonical NTP hydrolase)
MTTDTATSLGFVYINIADPVTQKPGHEVIRYDQFVRRLFKAQSEDLMKLHAGLGITGEAGEIADVIKREIIYGKKEDAEGKSTRAGMIEELGDLRFYIQAAMQMYGISEHEVLQGNADKLCDRYKKLVYSDDAALKREDKQ